MQGGRPTNGGSPAGSTPHSGRCPISHRDRIVQCLIAKRTSSGANTFVQDAVAERSAGDAMSTPGSGVRLRQRQKMEADATPAVRGSAASASTLDGARAEGRGPAQQVIVQPEAYDLGRDEDQSARSGRTPR